MDIDEHEELLELISEHFEKHGVMTAEDWDNILRSSEKSRRYEERNRK